MMDDNIRDHPRRVEQERAQQMDQLRRQSYYTLVSAVNALNNLRAMIPDHDPFAAEDMDEIRDQILVVLRGMPDYQPRREDLAVHDIQDAEVVIETMDKYGLGDNNR